MEIFQLTKKVYQVIDRALPKDAVDIHDMMVLQEGMGDCFYVDTLEHVRKHIKSTWVFNADGMAKAFLLCRVPLLAEDNLGYDIGLTDKRDLKKVVHMDSCVVLPELRGNRLMEQLLSTAIHYYKSKGFTRIMATVHPDNKPSIRSLQAVGLQVIMTKEKYDIRVPRHIMLLEV